MPPAAGGALLCPAEAAGQDRPNDAGEAAYRSAPESADGGRVQKGCDGGADTGTAVGNGKGKIEISQAGGRTQHKGHRNHGVRTEQGERTPDGVCASSEDQ